MIFASWLRSFQSLSASCLPPRVAVLLEQVEDDGRRERTLPRLAIAGTVFPAKMSPQLEVALSVWRRALAEEGRADASVDPPPEGPALGERNVRTVFARLLAKADMRQICIHDLRSICSRQDSDVSSSFRVLVRIESEPSIAFENKRLAARGV